MAFSIKDLAIPLATEQDGNNKEWLVVIGCGARSVNPDPKRCYSGTDGRYDRLDYAHGIKSEVDRSSVLAALRNMINELEELEEH